jgi:hypothetical protein
MTRCINAGNNESEKIEIIKTKKKMWFFFKGSLEPLISFAETEPEQTNKHE